MASPVAHVNWSNHLQWDFVKTNAQLDLYVTMGARSPERTHSWSLTNPDNYMEVMLLTLRRFHTAPATTAEVTRHALIAVQNAFARQALKEIDES